jgi:hypothetical protein
MQTSIFIVIWGDYSELESINDFGWMRDFERVWKALSRLKAL